MLMRFDPYREFDRLAEQLAATAPQAPRAFPMDGYHRGDDFIIKFDLPGVEPAAIEHDRRAKRPHGAGRAAL